MEESPCLGGSITAHLIINPAAGGFSGRRWKSNLAAFKTALQTASVNPPRNLKFKRHLTQNFAAEDLFKAALDREDGAFLLFIMAGGDGTHSEFLSALFRALQKAEFAALGKRCAVLRLPMGTGNDGSDSPDIARALSLLYKKSSVEWAGAVKVSVQSGAKGPFYAFNIASAGLDAFVTYMVNKMKKRLPGDFYKLWVDIASIFYDRIYKAGKLEIQVTQEDGSELCITEETLLLAMGVSGCRTYGSQKHILPDERNVCLTRQMSLLRKVALKDHFTAGTHINMPECFLFNARQLRWTSETPLLVQMDGEALLLSGNDFPVTFEICPHAIPILKPRE